MGARRTCCGREASRIAERRCPSPARPVSGDSDPRTMNILPEELVDHCVTLRRYRAAGGDDVVESRDASFEELRAWMPWSQVRPTKASVKDFVHPSGIRFGGNADANYAITLTDGG